MFSSSRFARTMARRPFIGGCIVAGVATLAIAHPMSPGQRGNGTATASSAGRSARADWFLPSIPKGQVCRVDGKQLDVSNWINESPSPVGVPNSSLASPDNLQSVWLCGDSDTVLVYPKLTVTFETGWSKADETSKWQAMVKDWGTGSEETVNGYPAYVAGVSPTTPRGELLYVVNGTLVRIIGDGSLSGEDLVLVGNSIRVING